ncbi:DUF899 family protein [Streptomyces sp. NPDC019531]|uniref:DUF899 family protein n=1 Tax=Streptomyces sp. NPDC019531 TaxID=3365062 RepID=UPI0038500835
MSTHLPEVVSREERLRARKELLAEDKEVTRGRDRRRLLMVRVEKPYVFEGPDGEVSLLELFEGGPSWSCITSCGPSVSTTTAPNTRATGCPSSSSAADQRPDRQPPAVARPGHLRGRGDISAFLRAGDEVFHPAMRLPDEYG